MSFQRKPNPINWSLLLGFASLAVSAGVAYLGWKAAKKAEERASETISPLEPGESVLLMGDSIAEGLDPHLRRLFEGFGSPFEARWKRGTTARYWDAESTDEAGGFDLVLLSLGSNDIAGSYWAPEEAAALDSLIGKLRSRGASVYWVRPPSFRYEGLTDAQAFFAELMRERGVFELSVQGPQPDVLSDPQHLHLTPDGYRTLASQLFHAATTAPYGQALA